MISSIGADDMRHARQPSPLPTLAHHKQNKKPHDDIGVTSLELFKQHISSTNYFTPNV